MECGMKRTVSSYDVLHSRDEVQVPLKVRAMVGLFRGRRGDAEPQDLRLSSRLRAEYQK